MSVKELLKKDEGAKNIDISELGIGDFKPIARRYGMDFAVVKSKYQDPPKYTVFFKAKDADTIEKVMNEYSAKCMKKEKEVGEEEAQSPCGAEEAEGCCRIDPAERSREKEGGGAMNITGTPLPRGSRRYRKGGG
jgi:hypothetical protein